MEHSLWIALDDYLRRRKKEDGLTEATFAEAVGASQATISRVRHRRFRPSEKLFEKIRIQTANKVLPGSWYSEIAKAA